MSPKTISVMAAVAIFGACAAAEATDEPATNLLTLINSYRAEHGRTPLMPDQALSDIARRHGEDMTTRQYFAHVSPDGSNLHRRLTDAGYRFKLAAENLARGYDNAAAVFSAWRSSQGHNRNLLRPNVSHAGIGFVDSAPDARGPIWVLIVAQPPDG